MLPFLLLLFPSAFARASVGAEKGLALCIEDSQQL